VDGRKCRGCDRIESYFTCGRLIERCPLARNSLEKQNFKTTRMKEE
jgi:hypothetical protein